MSTEETAKVIDWTKASQGLRNRSNKDCRKRWLKIDPRWNQGAWAIDEDDRLKRGVEQHQTRFVDHSLILVVATGANSCSSWKAVSDFVQTRNPDRKKYFLQPQMTTSKLIFWQNAQSVGVILSIPTS
jgi:hypothetical protein